VVVGALVPPLLVESRLVELLLVEPPLVEPPLVEPPLVELLLVEPPLVELLLECLRDLPFLRSFQTAPNHIAKSMATSRTDGGSGSIG
jgi:hypothetical protein